MKLFRTLLPLLLAACLLAGPEATAGPQEQFLERIAEASKIRDAGMKKQALIKLFNFTGVDPDTRERFTRKVIDQVLMKYIDPVLAFGPLPEDFDGVNVKDGVEYRPNLPLLGLVIINDRTRLAYGEAGGRLYFSASTRKVVNPHAAKDRPLSILVIGTISPERVKFRGNCRILLSNNQQKMLVVNDQGLGSFSLTLPGQRIDSCKITRTSAKGKLQLVLSEGERELFKSEFIDSDQPVVFERRER
ncbi:MAG: hypothetical protein JSU88_06605 [Nitrospinaceae bacterium]|nr:MAG: hypothetical protein JSU88_06605 [Nitrospinaceae bacterium]